MPTDWDVTTDPPETVKAIEHRRLRALVDADIEVAGPLHAPDFQLVNPRGGILSKEEYLGGIASGVLDYRRFEAVSEIEVMLSGDLAVLRYRSKIDIRVQGQGEILEAWHIDCYRRSSGTGWQVVWSQATAAS